LKQEVLTFSSGSRSPVCKDIPKQGCVKKGHFVKCDIHGGYHNPRNQWYVPRDKTPPFFSKQQYGIDNSKNVYTFGG
jgi:hypothetical protein